MVIPKIYSLWCSHSLSPMLSRTGMQQIISVQPSIQIYHKKTWSQSTDAEFYYHTNMIRWTNGTTIKFKADIRQQEMCVIMFDMFVQRTNNIQSVFWNKTRLDQEPRLLSFVLTQMICSKGKLSCSLSGWVWVIPKLPNK